jgi:hypothetical protein
MSGLEIGGEDLSASVVEKTRGVVNNLPPQERTGSLGRGARSLRTMSGDCPPSRLFERAYIDLAAATKRINSVRYMVGSNRVDEGFGVFRKEET